MRDGLPLRVGAAALMTMLGGCASEPGGSLEQNLLQQTLSGSGIVSESDKPEIEYRPRSPLVLPSRYDLRTPEDPNRVETQAAAWPKDPDAARRRSKAAEDALSVEDWRRYRSTGDAGRRPLSPEELERGRRPGAGYVQPGEAANLPNSPASAAGRSWGVLLPNEYQNPKSEEQRAREAAIEAGAEPPRRYLTEPPVGYRARVPSKTPDGQPAAEAVAPEQPWYKKLWPFSGS